MGYYQLPDAAPTLLGNQQPAERHVINRLHPIANGLVFATYGVEDYNLVSGKWYGRAGVNVLNDVCDDGIGHRRSTGGGNTWIDTGETHFAVGDDWSAFALVHPVSTFDTNSWIFHIPADGTYGAAGFLGNTTRTLGIFMAGSSSPANTGLPSPAVGETSTVAFGHKSGSAPRFFCNGEFEDGSSTVTNNFAVNDLRLHNRESGFGHLDSILLLLMLWNRKITDEEMLCLWKNPYQLLRAEVQMPFYVPDAAVGGGYPMPLRHHYHVNVGSQ